LWWWTQEKGSGVLTEALTSLPFGEIIHSELCPEIVHLKMLPYLEYNT
jgi:hypothetical protein